MLIDIHDFGIENNIPSFKLFPNDQRPNIASRRVVER
jgi:hypothetical protein